MKLDEYLKANKLNKQEFADKVGTLRSNVSRWASGARRPTIDALQKIDDATNGAVTARDFYE